MSREWLLIAHGNYTLCVYSLPELQYKDQVNFSFPVIFPRADRAGLVYAPLNDQISILRVNDTGKLTLTHNLTLGDTLNVTLEDSPPARIAAGPRLGELCVGLHSPPRVVILNVSDGSITRELSLPDGTSKVWSVGVLDTGQILVSMDIQVHGSLSLAMYSSFSRSPVIIYNRSPLGRAVGMIDHANQFLVTLPFSVILVVDADGRLVSTVDILNGKGGVWLDATIDVAMWHNCAWVLSLYASMVLLCPI